MDKNFSKKKEAELWHTSKAFVGPLREKEREREREREREAKKGLLLLEKEEEDTAFSRGEKKKHCEKGREENCVDAISFFKVWSDPTILRGLFLRW